jgi:hypothetical protein
MESKTCGIDLTAGIQMRGKNVRNAVDLCLHCTVFKRYVGYGKDREHEPEQQYHYGYDDYDDQHVDQQSYWVCVE